MDFVNRDKSAQSYLQELILITTFAGSASNQSPSQLKDKSGRPVSLRSLLISLSVYWGIASVLLGGQDDNELSRSVEVLMAASLTHNASISIQEDILRLLSASLLPSKRNNHPAAVMYSRLSTAISASFKTPLMFATLMGLSVHSDLSLKQDERSAADQSCVQLVRMVSALAPRDGLVSAEVSGCTPLAMVASFHSPIRAHGEEDDLVLALTRVLCASCPSALTVPCGRGLYPLHLAARDGESSVLQHFASRYPFTVPLKDSFSRFALEIALDHSYLHSEAALLQLAQIYPPAAAASREQVLIFARQKNVSTRLSEALVAMCEQYSSPESVCPEVVVSEVSVSPRSIASSPSTNIASVSPILTTKKQPSKQFSFSSGGADRDAMFSVADSLLALNCVSVSSSSNCSDSLSSASCDSLSSRDSRGGFKNVMKRKRMSECALEDAVSSNAKSLRMC
jgi:hypothetical protein